jgi:hypothetical protein
VVVVLGDRLARPVPVDITHLEVLEVPAEGAIDGRHGRHGRERRAAGANGPCEEQGVDPEEYVARFTGGAPLGAGEALDDGPSLN